MRQFVWYIIVECIVLVICSVATAEPFAKGPYLGQTPPGSTAQVFAPGLISDTRPQVWESNGTFSADGNTFCYVRNSVHRSPGDGSFFITENTDQGWTAPKLIESIREEHAAWGPCLSPDANSIYFTFAFVEPWSKRNIYRCDRTAHGWSDPQSLGPPISSPMPELTCSIAMNNSIYVGSARKGGGIQKQIDMGCPFCGQHMVPGRIYLFEYPRSGGPRYCPG